MTNSFVQTLTSKNAAALDKDLMSVGAFSLDQLMELAGLSVSQAGKINAQGFFMLYQASDLASLASQLAHQPFASSL